MQMKKAVIKGTAFLIMALLMLSVVSCSNSSDGDGVDSSGSPTVTNTDIVGKWVYDPVSRYKEYLTDVITEDIYYAIYYQFNSDGTGSTGKDDSELYTFKYDFDGKILTVYFEDGTSQNLECSIDYKRDVLTVHNSDTDRDIKFKKET